MIIVLAVIAVACVALIVWAAPGVWRAHRIDVTAHRAVRALYRMQDAFSGLSVAIIAVVRALEEFAQLSREGTP